MSLKQDHKINKIFKEIETYRCISRKELLDNHIKVRLEETLKRYEEDLSECINLLSLENQIKLVRKIINES